MNGLIANCRRFHLLVSPCTRNRINKYTLGSLYQESNRTHISKRFSSTSIKASIKKGPETTSVVERQFTSWIVFKMFSKYLWPHSRRLRTSVGIAVCLLVSSKVLNVQVPWIFKHIIDSLAITSDNKVLVLPLAALLGYGIARAGTSLFQELRNALFSEVTQNAIREITGKTFLHLLNMDLSFHLSRDTGGLSRAIDRGTRGISVVMFSLLFNIVPTILEIALVCGIMSYSFGFEYAIVTFTTLVVYTFFTFRITKWRDEFRREMNNYDNQSSSLSIDALINYETVKYFSNEKLELKRYDDIMRLYNKAAVKVQTSLSLLNFGQGFIFSVALTAVMIMGSIDIVSGALTVGDLVMINGLLFQLSVPLNFLGTVHRELKQSLIDMDVLFSLSHVKSAIVNEPNAKELVLSGGRIEFKDVSFYYDEEANIVKNLSIVIPAGKKVAIVGTSGGGKSTLFRLLYRFYDPKKGHICIDGQDIKTVTLESLRRHIAVVPQDNILFNASIKYNIEYGNPGASTESIEKCSRLANIYDAIMRMPNGYDTIVGERGLKISGGEKQRICLARALMKEPSILLLDEATSGLDAESEQAIHAALDKITKNRTVVMISHRLKTVESADIIFVLDRGTVVEQGTHAQLIANPNGVYHNLVKMQSLTT